MVDVSNSDSKNSYNDDDPYKAADPEAADPEDAVEIIGVDEQEYEHARVLNKNLNLKEWAVNQKNRIPQ